MHDPQISPDGTWVAYVLSRSLRRAERAQSDIWLVSSDGRRRAQLTNRYHRDAAPRWSPDGKRIAYLAPDDDSDVETPQIWLIPVAGGESRRLTNLEQGVLSIAWSPDGGSLAFLATDPKPRGSGQSTRHPNMATAEGRVYASNVAVVDRLRYRSAAYPPKGQQRHIYTVKVSDGRVAKLTDGECDDVELCWSPDGKQIAFTSNRGRDSDWDIVHDIWLVPAQGGRPRQFTAMAGGASGPAWSPDGKLIAFMGVLEGRVPQDAYRVWVQPVSGEAATSLTESVDEVPHSIRWAADGSQIYFQHFDKGYQSILRAGLDGRAQRLLPRERFVSAYSVAASEGSIAYLHSTPEHPDDVFVCNSAGEEERRLTHVNRAVLGTLQLGKTESFWCASFDGTRVQAWTVRPPHLRANRHYPLILMIHGGPAAAYFTSWNFQAQVLAARGYVVLFANPRGSRGYGTAFMNSVTGRWGDEDARDLLQVLEKAISRGGVDPERIGVTGQSYGGFMATWLLGKTRRFRAGVAECAAADRRMWYYSGDVHLWCEEDCGGPPWERSEAYLSASSTTHAHSITAPLLLLHAEDDRRVPVCCSEILYTTVKRLGIESVFVRYPYGDHGFSHSSALFLCDTLNRTIDWFGRHLAARRRGR